MADLRLTVALSASDKLSAPLRKMAEASGRLGKEFIAASEHLKNLKNQEEAAARSINLQNSLKKAGSAFVLAKDQFDAFKKSVGNTADMGKTVAKRLKDLQSEAARLESAYKRQLEQLGKMNGEMRKLGLTHPERDQQRLRAAIEQTTQALARQQARMEKLNALRQRRDRATALGGELAGYGYGMYYGGQRVIGGMAHALEPAKEGQRQEARIRALKMDPQQTETAIEHAKNLRTAGVSTVETLSLLGDGMSAFGNVHHAEMALPMMAKVHATIAQMFPHGGGEELEKKLIDSLKAIDLRGGTRNQEEFNKQANMVMQVLIGSNGRVGPEQWNELIRRSGVMGMGIKDEAFYYKLEPLMQMTSGATVGTSLMSLYQSLYQGKTTKRAMGNLERLGLVEDESKVDHDKAGQISHINPGAVKGGDLLKSDPVAWVNTVLVPQLATKGITTKDGILDAIGSITGSRTAANFMGLAYQNRDLIERDAARNKGAENADQLHDRLMGTASGQEQKLAKSKEDLFRNVGTAALPAYVKLLEVLTSVVDKLSEFAQAHPTITKWLAIGVAGMAAFTMAAGVLIIPLAVLVGQFALLRFGLTYLGAGGLGKALSLLRIVGPAAGAAGGKLALLTRAGQWLASAWRMVAPVVLGLGRALFMLSRFLVATPIGLAITALVAAGYLIYKYWDQIKAFFVGLGSALSWAWNRISQACAQFWGAIKSSVAAGVDAVMGALRAWRDGVMGFWRTLAAPFQGLVGHIFSGAWDKVLADMSALPGKFAQAGSAMVSGWIEGFKSMFPQAYETISGWSDSLVGWFKEKLGIASPSKVFMTLGGFIGQGAALGIEQGQPLVSRAALALAGAASAIAAPVALAAGLAPAAGGLGGTRAGAASPAFGGSTYSITINAQPGMDAQAIARAVRTELDKRERALRSRVMSQLSDTE